VDYRWRARCLAQVERALQSDRAGAMGRFFAEWPDARFKLATLQTLLAFRRDHPALLAAGDYQPLYAQGPQAECIIAFAREHRGETLLSLSARFPARLEAAGFAAESVLDLPEALRGHEWADLLTGRSIADSNGTLSARALFRELPAAVLVKR
jgi:(1->4)-alpha-D-glucan 1-alpha-D-glucosylmutase